MSKLRLSRSIADRTPSQRRKHTLANLKWIGRNLMLSNAERIEVKQAIREKEAQLNERT